MPKSSSKLLLSDSEGNYGQTILPCSLYSTQCSPNADLERKRLISTVVSHFAFLEEFCCGPNTEAKMLKPLFKIVGDGTGAERVNVKFGCASAQTIEILDGLK